MKRQGHSRDRGSVGFGDRVNEGKDGQRANLDIDESLDEALRGGADTRAHTPTNLFLLCQFRIEPIDGVVRSLPLQSLKKKVAFFLPSYG